MTIADEDLIIVDVYDAAGMSELTLTTVTPSTPTQRNYVMLFEDLFFDGIQNIAFSLRVNNDEPLLTNHVASNAPEAIPIILHPGENLIRIEATQVHGIADANGNNFDLQIQVPMAINADNVRDIILQNVGDATSFVVWTPPAIE